MGSMIVLLASLFKEQEDVVIFCNSNDIENLTNGLNFAEESGSLSHKDEKLRATCYTIEGKSIYLIDKKNEYDFYNYKIDLNKTELIELLKKIEKYQSEGIKIADELHLKYNKLTKNLPIDMGK